MPASSSYYGAFSFACFASGVAGHGMLIRPPPRNNVDRFLPEFAGGKSPYGDSCVCGDGFGSPRTGCDMGVRASGGGQGCFWFSQGCTIGCPTCTGIGSHSNVSLCETQQQATLPDWARTMNIHAKAGSINDTYKHNPWRAPGTAPTFDACGRAGGTDPKHFGPGDAKFLDTPFAKGGELGSQVLPPAPSGTIWTAGGTAEVAWGTRYNHGGGYIYRLCPAHEALTEECFWRHVLEFDITGQQLEWTNGTRYAIRGTWVAEGTYPPGSMWAMNPIPRINFDSHSSGQPRGASGCALSNVTGGAVGPACRQFEPPCPQDGESFACGILRGIQHNNITT